VNGSHGGSVPEWYPTRSQTRTRPRKEE
jgi:hypothetical protein